MATYRKTPEAVAGLTREQYRVTQRSGTSGLRDCHEDETPSQPAGWPVEPPGP